MGGADRRNGRPSAMPSAMPSDVPPDARPVISAKAENGATPENPGRTPEASESPDALQSSGLADTTRNGRADARGGVASTSPMRRYARRSARALQHSLVGRIVTALLQINLRDRALTLAGQAFLALVPLLIVLAVLVSSADGQAVADWLVGRFSLTGPTAEAVRTLFDKPPSATGGMGVIGLLMLLLSVTSFAKSLQRTYEMAWGLPRVGGRKSLLGLGGALVVLISLGGAAYLGGLLAEVASRPVILMVQIVVSVPGWWVGVFLLVGGRVPWMLLMPGAVVSSVGQALTGWAGSVWVPRLVERNIERYGVIGAAIALISWLLVLSLVVVATAVIGAQVGASLNRTEIDPPGHPHDA